MEAATVSEQQEGPSLSNDATTGAGQRSKFFQKSSSFFSRSSTVDPAASDAPSRLSVAGLSTWAKNLKLPAAASRDSNGEAKDSKSPLSVLTSGFTKRNATKIPVVDEVASAPATSTPVQEGAFGTLTRGFLDSSRNAVKVVQTRARHLVSQNKRRYQEGGFDLDMTYITDSIIAMGFPAGDMSSGLFGYVEGFYRNHMEEVIKFFESHHKGKYKVYNLCSERLYDVSLLAGKVASFPFDDHNCPPLQLVMAFCRSAYSWLKEDLENVVVVHCKAGMARTGLMISCLLLYLKFWPTAEECITNYNERRCIDGKGLVLPSQLRYVKYFERVLKEFNGETPSGRKCILRGIRLHRCPYWIRPAITISDHNGVLFSTKKHPRTKDMMPDDFWFAAPRKGVMVFALPGERCVADLDGDFKVHFHDRNGDFYCWLNTNMMEARQLLNTSDLDGFQKRRLPSPGFQVEIVTLDANASVPAPMPHPEVPKPPEPAASAGKPTADSKDNDDVFSDSESEEGSAKGRRQKKEKASSAAGAQAGDGGAAEPSQAPSQERTAATKPAEKDDAASDYVHVKEPAAVTSVSANAATAGSSDTGKKPEGEHNDFRAIAADASIFTFGDEDDEYDSEG